MAIDLTVEYPGKIDTTDPTGYPQGKPRNVTTPGDNTGTPWEEKIAQDIVGFLQALLAADAASPSGTPDKVGASQYLTAIQNLAQGAKGIIGTKGLITTLAVTPTIITNETTGVLDITHYGFASSGNEMDGRILVDLSDDTFVGAGINASYTGTLTTSLLQVSKMRTSAGTSVTVYMTRQANGDVEISTSAGPGTYGMHYIIL